MANRGEMAVQIPSEEVIRRMREQSPVCMLAFSLGKDATAAWLAIRDVFEQIIPIHRYIVPGLEFIEEQIAYFEDFFDTKIIQVPKPSTYRMLKNLVYQPPERCRFIEASGIDEVTHEQINDYIREDFGLGREVYVASGVRFYDSLSRQTHFRVHGAISDTNQAFYPIWDWRKDKVYETLKASGVKMPVDYLMFGKSFDAIKLPFLLPIKKYYPRDYRKILEYFPLAELQVFQWEQMRSK